MPPIESVSPVHTRADVWHTANTQCLAQYRLQAEAEADVLCRALNLFALQGLTPQQVHVEREDDLLTMEILMDGLSWHRAQVIAEKLRNLISVCSVTLRNADETWLEPAHAVG